MNIKSKKILIIMIAAILSIMVMPNRAHAGLQANKGGKSLVNVYANIFFKEIRKMETEYGTLGKNAILDTTTYLDSTANGIDCHMALNTEFGTAGILAHSEYGTIPTESNDTTTGNASGIYQLGYGKYEYVAGIYSSTNSYTNIIEKADARYYNKYASSTSIPGDGMGKLGFSASYPSSSYPIIYRSINGVLRSNNYDGSSFSHYCSRAVVVCGAGL